MELVAGPQGSGKSTFFPVGQSGYDAFNIDDHRKALSGGSSQGFSQEIQKRAAADYEAFIEGHIRDKRSFSIEVTLGKDVTFDQAERAQAQGFSVRLSYIAADVETCVERMANRVDAGGHGVPEGLQRQIHATSLANLPKALRQFDSVDGYDNSLQASAVDTGDAEPLPQRVLTAQQGKILFAAPKAPPWLRQALK